MQKYSKLLAESGRGVVVDVGHVVGYLALPDSLGGEGGVEFLEVAGQPVGGVQKSLLLQPIEMDVVGNGHMMARCLLEVDGADLVLAAALGLRFGQLAHGNYWARVHLACSLGLQAS